MLQILPKMIAKPLSRIQDRLNMDPDEDELTTAELAELVADQVRVTRPHLRTTALPFGLYGSAMELLWPAAVDDDDACRFLRDRIIRITRKIAPRS